MRNDPVQIPGYRIEGRLHESRTHTTYRAVRDGGPPVVIKTVTAEYPSRQEAAELRREFKIMQRLADVEQVIDVLALEPHGNGNVAIVMEGFGVSLARMMTERGGEAISLQRFLPMAIQIARTIGAVHTLDIVHKDLVPANILLDEVTGEIRITDFSISSELSRERQSVNLSRRLEGSLPYISPEQTGRMNRDLDYRTDYYSLGVTFFELLTGQLPFTADDVLEWSVSDALVGPASAHRVRPWSRFWTTGGPPSLPTPTPPWTCRSRAPWTSSPPVTTRARWCTTSPAGR